ncbi:X8 domain [Musa troglodytarum]|uniref:X8 domain n=1 Tax=Musa troglodytarum TaxID=320322 RepID=A0A9E7GAR0_9LILI|nr:X8 domain [Musa troglodytarum]
MPVTLDVHLLALGVKGRAVRIRMAGVVVLVAATVVGMIGGARGAPTWCIARNGAGATTLQAALDYACGSGLADCAPVQPSGFCYLPNTLPSHASYAFNSYYQRSNAAPGACDFGGTATVTVTDPSQCSLSLSHSSSVAWNLFCTVGSEVARTLTTQGYSDLCHSWNAVFR